jgi:hypothetical protein
MIPVKLICGIDPDGKLADQNSLLYDVNSKN